MRLIIVFGIFLMACQSPVIKKDYGFVPGEIWSDVDGHAINAHGGGMLVVNKTYYWYGEIKEGKTRLVPGQNWEDYRVDAGGISCYSSEDLVHWKNLGVVLKPDLQDSSSDLHISRVIERPKVIFNKNTGKYVMWMHIDRDDYSAARAGVAVADRPEGPFTYLRSERPNGNMSRDMTIFQDEDGRAYHFYSSENNSTMHVCELSQDYLSHTMNDKRILIGQSREAPVVIKHDRKYFLITSATTGWSPNAASTAVADSVMGDWSVKKNPCVGVDADSSFHSQGTYAFRLNDSLWIYMADRWNKTDLPDSRYVWLPMRFLGEEPVVEWRDKW